MNHFSIRLGLSRHITGEYVEGWIVGIEDLTPRVRKIHEPLQSGQAERAKMRIPPERAYPVTPEFGRRLLIKA